MWRGGDRAGARPVSLAQGQTNEAAGHGGHLEQELLIRVQIVVDHTECVERRVGAIPCVHDAAVHPGVRGPADARSRWRRCIPVPGGRCRGAGNIVGVQRRDRQGEPGDRDEPAHASLRGELDAHRGHFATASVSRPAASCTRERKMVGVAIQRPSGSSARSGRHTSRRRSASASRPRPLSIPASTRRGNMRLGPWAVRSAHATARSSSAVARSRGPPPTRRVLRRSGRPPPQPAPDRGAAGAQLQRRCPTRRAFGHQEAGPGRRRESCSQRALLRPYGPWPPGTKIDRVASPLTSRMAAIAPPSDRRAAEIVPRGLTPAPNGQSRCAEGKCTRDRGSTVFDLVPFELPAATAPRRAGSVPLAGLPGGGAP